MAWTDEDIERATAAFDAFDPARATVVNTEDLRAVARTAEAMRVVEEQLTKAVTLAREHGHSWNRIALALGVSQHTARQRYGQKAS